MQFIFEGSRKNYMETEVLVLPNGKRVSVEQRNVQYTGLLADVAQFALMNQSAFDRMTIISATDKLIIN